MPTVYAYIRVSTAKQVASGLGLASQVKQLDKYFEYIATKEEYADLEKGSYFREEGESAMKKQLLHRPQGEALNSILKPGDHVVFVRLDRGFRDTRDLLNTWDLWKQRDVTIHFLDINVDTSTANGEFFVTVIGAVSRWESRVKSERQLALAEYLRSQGRKTSNDCPLGWTTNGRNKVLIPHVETALVMRRIAYLHDEKRMWWTAISELLEREEGKREGRTNFLVDSARTWRMLRVNRAYIKWKSDDNLRTKLAQLVGE